MKEKEDNKGTLEISLLVKDINGQPTGARKTFSTNSPLQLWLFWQQHQPKPKRNKKNKKQKGEATPNAQDADKILREMYNN